MVEPPNDDLLSDFQNETEETAFPPENIWRDEQEEKHDLKEERHHYTCRLTTAIVVSATTVVIVTSAVCCTLAYYVIKVFDGDTNAFYLKLGDFSMQILGEEYCNIDLD